VRRTQHGNNNAYCQDNETSWFDWTLPERHAGILRFTRQLLRLRQAYRFGGREHMPLERLLAQAEVTWHGVQAECPDWSHASRSIAFSAGGLRFDYYVVFNAYWEALTFELPKIAHGHGPWHRIMDSSLPSPEDILGPGQLRPVESDHYQVEARSVAVFFSPVNKWEGVFPTP
jgi:glycogen operon protein